MKETIKNSPVGFYGERFFEADYNYKRHIVQIKDGLIYAYTKEPIAASSAPYYDGYLSQFTINEITDLFLSKITAIYKGNKYKVGSVSANGEGIELIGDYKDWIRDEKLGIVYDREFDVRHKIVSLAELDDVEFERHSIYQEFKNQLEGKNEPELKV